VHDRRSAPTPSYAVWPKQLQVETSSGGNDVQLMRIVLHVYVGLITHGLVTQLDDVPPQIRQPELGASVQLRPPMHSQVQ
jgi:hypothetical protein